MIPSWPAVRVIGLLLSLSLAGAVRPLWGQRPATSGRQLEAGRWQEVGHFDPEGELLDSPQLISTTGDTLFVLDYGDKSIRAFDRRGKVLWKAGRSGSGPGELANPTSMVLGPDGELWLNDPMNGRITRFSTRGVFAGQTTVAEQLLQVVPRRDGGFIGLGSAANTLMQDFDSNGRAGRQIPLPDSLGRVGAITRQSLVVGDDRQIAIFFRFSSLFYIVRLDSALIGRHDGPEAIPFPAPLRVSTKVDGQTVQITRANPNAVIGARAVFRGERESIWVLFGGTGPSADRVIDRFDLSTGRYLGSRALPRKVVAVAAWGRDIVGVVEDPVPSIYVWRWVPAGGRSR